MSLVAVGGYGRRELHLASDIDLSILLEAEVSPQCQERIGQFLQSLWDGLDIGHSVRTLAQCMDEARNDCN